LNRFVRVGTSQNDRLRPMVANCFPSGEKAISLLELSFRLAMLEIWSGRSLSNDKPPVGPFTIYIVI